MSLYLLAYTVKRVMSIIGGMMLIEVVWTFYRRISLDNAALPALCILVFPIAARRSNTWRFHIGLDQLPPPTIGD